MTEKMLFSLLVCLYFLVALTVPVFKLPVLAAAALASLYLVRLNGRETMSPAEKLAPLIVVFFAAALDPVSGVPDRAEACSPVPYRQVLYALTALMALAGAAVCGVSGLGRLKGSRTVDGWAVSLGVFSVLFYLLFVNLFSDSPAPREEVYSTAGFLAAVTMLYISSRLLVRAGSARFVNLALAGVFALAALSCLARFAAAEYYCRQATAALDSARTADAAQSVARAAYAGGTLALNSLDARIEALSGRRSYLDGEYSDALGHAASAVELAPLLPDGYRLAGDIGIKMRDWRAAAAGYEAARRADPSDTSYFPALALAYSMTRSWRTGAFLADFEGGLTGAAVKPGDMVALAGALNRWGRHEEAFGLADRAIETGNRTYYAFLERGAAREHLGEPEKALEDLETAADLEPGRAIAAYGRLEKLYARMGRHEDSARVRAAGLALETARPDISVFKTNRQAGWAGGRMTIGINGSARKKVMLYSGRFRVLLAAKSEQPGRDRPFCEITLDDRPIGDTAIESGRWDVYGFDFDVAEAGIYALGITYRSELYPYVKSTDLYVREVIFERLGDE